MQKVRIKIEFDLEARWKALGERAGVKDWESWNMTFDALNAMYSENGRYYHTLDHIEDGLGKLEMGRGIATNLDAVEAALWFHDAFYDVKRQDNEERSAIFARESLIQAGVGRAFAENVERMVMFTRHQDRPTDVDAQILVDIDLSSLGVERAIFEGNTDNIWKEYSHIVGIEVFNRERVKILQGFLNRKPIYMTKPFRDKYEQAAKDNLEKSIAQLSA